MDKTKSYNMEIWVVMSILISIGIIMVYSASGIMADYKYGSSTMFFWKQLLWVCLGGISMLFFSYFDYNKLRSMVIPLLLFTFVLLVFVLIFGTTVGGAKRWLRFGPLGFQPSEVAKLTVIIFLAWYVDRRKSKMKNFKEGLLKPLLIVGVILILVFAERDIGVPLLIFSITIILLIIGGANLGHVFLMSIAGIPVIIYTVIKEPYRIRRITTFLNPWADPQGSGYQLVQSLLAMGSGGLRGIGLGESRVKMLFLPEPHTDFIFPIIGEELGLFGTIFVLFLFLILLYFGVKIALGAKDLFGSILAFGITIMVTFQSLINMSVSVGLLPTKGLPLPFISFGGSSILIMMTSIGILLNIGKQTCLPAGR
ncbi:MAG: putative lipid II flippase FtsW [Elusimicrobia bacterium]|nr:putative lipid II flippase FtsW [Elusimicrobiota bacterium]